MSASISVIVPVYNVENYLEECVSSILMQDYTDFELLLVDDGSTDSSGMLCDKLQQIDSRIKVFHKPNGGLSDARNYGIEHAEGRYLTFIDSDDLIVQGYFSTLTELISDFDADAACLPLWPTENRLAKPDNSKTESGCVTGQEAVSYSFLRKCFGVSACGKLFKTELFKSSRFPVGQLYEDLLTIPYIFVECEKVAYSSAKLYLYYIRPGSITHSKITEKHLALLDNFADMIVYLDAHCPQAHAAAVTRFCIESVKRLVDILLLTEGYFQIIGTIKEKSRQYWTEGKSNPLLPRSIKIQIRVIDFSPLLYWLMFMPYKKMKNRAQNITIG